MSLSSCFGLLFFSGVSTSDGSAGRRFRCWEIDSMDRASRTHANTLTTKATSGVVDVRNIILYRNGSKRTLLLTLATTDTSSLTSLHGNRSLILVDTRDKDSPTLWSLLAKLNDVAWTCLSTSTTFSAEPVRLLSPDNGSDR